MKKLFIFIAFSLITVTFFAQAKTVTYFNKLPSDITQGYKIKYSKGKYSVIADTECSITVDSKNGYLKIVDNGTGGGIGITEMAIFKTDKGKDIVAHNHYSYENKADYDAGTINFFDVSNKMENITATVWPDISQIEDLLPANVSKSDIEPYTETEYTYCVLPKVGTTINMHLGFKSLNNLCNNNDTAACALKKKLLPSKLVWNKKTKSFDLK